MKKREITGWICVLLGVCSVFLYTQKKLIAKQQFERHTFALEDWQQKERDVTALVDRAVQEIEKNTRDAAFYALTWGSQFKQGELYIFVHDMNGVIWAQGDAHKDILWKNFDDVKDDFGAYFVRGLRAIAQEHGQQGGWYTYQWNRATKKAYVRLVEKDGKAYVVGSGYYPSSIADYVVSFVKGGVAAFNSLIAQGFDKEAAFGFLNYPGGTFRYGDLYLYIFDEQGFETADVGVPDHVGLNIGTILKDKEGNLIIPSVIKDLMQQPTGAHAWFSYYFKGALKKAYTERIVDNNGASYFVASGYWPGTTHENVINLVEKGLDYATTHTPQEVARAFSFAGTQYESSPFMAGDIHLIAVDMNGICLAHGDKPGLVGKSLWDLQDDDDRYIMRTIITGLKKKTSGWFEFKRNNAFWSVYAKKGSVNGSEIIVLSGFYPVSKASTANLLLTSAAELLGSSAVKDACKRFVSDNDNFARGDLSVLVLDARGYCYADGLNRSHIWRNFFLVKDEAGSLSYKKLAQKLAQVQEGKVVSETMRRHKALAVIMGQKVTHKNGTYFVCTHFFP